jgi:nucleoside-diphosphate-sugar epimerase
MVELNSVQKFYKDKKIFITGASGFMGKVLLEKLLYSCSELKQIVILMRPKRGKSEIERVANFVNIPVNFYFPFNYLLTSFNLQHKHFKTFCVMFNIHFFIYNF